MFFCRYWTLLAYNKGIVGLYLKELPKNDFKFRYFEMLQSIPPVIFKEKAKLNLHAKVQLRF